MGGSTSSVSASVPPGSAKPIASEQTIASMTTPHATPLHTPPYLSPLGTSTNRSPLASPPAASSSSLDPLRVAGSALSTLIAHATAAAQDHERALSATSEAAIGWQQRATLAEAEATQLASTKTNLQAELAAYQQDRNSIAARSVVLEQRLGSLEQAHAGQLLREREAEARALELEAQLASRSSDLRAVQQAHALVQQQKQLLEEELSSAMARMHTATQTHLQEQTQMRSRLETERDSQAEAARQTTARLQAELETARIELTRRLQVEQDASARLRDELRAAHQENERLNELRSRERLEAEVAAQHALEIQKAANARM
jgi:hypothetical protein